MIRSLIRCGVLVGAIGLGGCELEVLNTNNPGTVQVKGTPADLENFLGTQYRRWHSALYGVTGNIWGMAAVQSFENFSTLSNNCQGQRVGIPRPGNDNAVGNVCGGDQALIFNRASEVARGVSEVLRALDAGLSFGPPADLDARGRAFAEFLRGVSLGYLALVYDSASVITPTDPLTPQGTAEPGVFSGYQEVMAEAITALDNAVTHATGATFTLPPNWMFSTVGMTAAEFVKVVRSYRARFRANVARNPAERAAVDWAAVIADAQNGITADHRITTSTVTGPGKAWVNQWYAYVTWHQAVPFIYGMGDNSGAYAAWIALPLDSRGASGAFLMTTPDQRFPQGADRAAQRADFDLAGTGGCSGANQVCKRFFRNRPVTDPPASPSWGASQYDHTRYYSWRTAGAGTATNGPIAFFLLAELNLLEAEGHYRQGNYALAAALINRTRAACGPGGVPAGCTARPAGNGLTGDPGGGLPAITVFDATTPVPGGVDCVPKVPANAAHSGGGTVSCGTLLEALKWEKRIETAYSHLAGWLFDSRGWGDLPQGTPVHWAPPYQELQTRNYSGLQIYSVGGPNPTGGAGPSTYGW